MLACVAKRMISTVFERSDSPSGSAPGRMGGAAMAVLGVRIASTFSKAFLEVGNHPHADALRQNVIEGRECARQVEREAHVESVVAVMRVVPVTQRLRHLARNRDGVRHAVQLQVRDDDLANLRAARRPRRLPRPCQDWCTTFPPTMVRSIVRSRMSTGFTV